MLRLQTLLIAVLLVCSAIATAQTPSGGPRPIVVQGAMQIEVERLASRLNDVNAEQIGSWMFWRGRLDGYPVIVSKTLKGTANAAAATALTIQHYQPAAIINQGTAGGHEPSLHVYDIVLGTSAVNLGAFRSPFRAVGAGSNTLDWRPLDLTLSDGSAGNDPNQRTLARFKGDEALLAAARSVKSSYKRGAVVEGALGSSDVWNDELDRVRRFNSEFGTLAEEMETAAAQIAGLFKTPFLGIRVLSDNITNGGAYDPKTSEACEDFVYDVVKAYVAEIRGANR